MGEEPLGIVIITTTMNNRTREQPFNEFGETQRRINAELVLLENQHKRVEELLHESREKFRIITTLASDATITIDNQGNVSYWNPAAETMFGYRTEEILGKEFHRLFTPQHNSKSIRKTLGIFQTMGKGDGAGKKIELKALKKDGSEFPVELSVSALKLRGRWNAIVIIRDITLRRREKELERLATTDLLTKAYNRVKFDEIFGRETERVRRYNQSLSMIMLDIDHFKEVNDTYGHITGDHVLKSVADIARENMRKIDYLIRWGGEEFMIITPETDFSRAVALAERIRKVIESFSFKNAKSITVSFGVTQFKKDDTVDSLIKRADSALYKAKMNGKNRVEVIV